MITYRRTDYEGFSTHPFNCNAVFTNRKFVSSTTHKDSIGAGKFGLSDNVYWESGARNRDEGGLTTRTLKAGGFAAGFVTPFCSVEKQASPISCHFLLACSAVARVEQVWQVCSAHVTVDNGDLTTNSALAHRMDCRQSPSVGEYSDQYSRPIHSFRG